MENNAEKNVRIQWKQQQIKWMQRNATALLNIAMFASKIFHIFFIVEFIYSVIKLKLLSNITSCSFNRKPQHWVICYYLTFSSFSGDKMINIAFWFRVVTIFVLNAIFFNKYVFLINLLRKFSKTLSILLIYFSFDCCRYDSTLR